MTRFDSTAVMMTLLVSCVFVVCAPTVALAISCGEILPDGDTCTDWQCSRNVSNFCVRGEPLGAECQYTSDCYYQMHCEMVNTTIQLPNGTNTTEMVGTCQKDSDAGKNIGIGLVGAVLGVICFGSSFVPIKRYKKYAGDGVFAQFCMCFGRFMVGVCFLAASDNLTFYWSAAAGGALWTLGNVLSVPIIQCIGIGLGVSIWGTTNMLLGWASGHFGLMGVKAESTEYPALEYCSVAASFVGIILFIFVKPSSRVQKNEPTDDEASPVGSPTSEDYKKVCESSDLPVSKFPLLPERESCDGDRVVPYSAVESLQGTPKSADQHSMATEKNITKESDDDTDDDDTEAAAAHLAKYGDKSPLLSSGLGEKSTLSLLGGFNNRSKRQTLADTLGGRKARIIGISMALTSGCLYGICMNFAQHLMTNYGTLTAESDFYKYSPKGLDYVFSNNVGAMCMSFVVLVVYLVMQKFGLTPSEKYFEPVNHGKLLLPAFAAGAIGSMGSAAWFFANQNLGLVVSFPIIAAGPGVVSSLWGALVFKEVHGIKNFAILGGAFIMVIMAAVFSSIAKGDKH